MTTEHQLLEKHLKKSSLISNLLSISLALFAALSVGYGFYYNTSNTLKANSKDIEDVKKEVKEVRTKMNDTDVFKGISSEKFNEIEKKVDRMDEKLDKILIQTNR